MRLQTRLTFVVGAIILSAVLVWVLVAQALFVTNYQQLEKSDVQGELNSLSELLTE